MPAIYQGDKKIVDRYVGEKLITRAYQGDKLIFDAYSELSGTLPLTVRSRASQILENYHIYGTVSGAGVETRNLFDKDITDGIEDNYYIDRTTGNKVSNTRYYISAPIAVTSEETYSWVFRITPRGIAHGAPTVGFFDANDNQIGVASHGVGVKAFSFTTPANCAYIKASVYKYDIGEAMLVLSSTAPSSYIPYGYELPITVKTENEIDVDAIEANKTLQTDGGITASNFSMITDYMKIKPLNDYTLSYNYMQLSNSSNRNLIWYDQNKNYISYTSYTTPNKSTTFTSPQAAMFCRVSLDKNVTVSMFVKGSTPPDHYIPYYNTETPIYIGDSQLKEGEYVDYESGKIYKRGENEFPFAEEGTFTFGNGSVISDGAGTFIINTENNDTNVPSELIPLTTPYTVPQTSGEYTFYLGNTSTNPGLLIVFYDSERNLVDDWMYNSTWRKESSIPLMVGKTIAYVGFRINTNYSGSANMSVTPMISKNNNLTAYVPYIQPTDPLVPLPDITIPKGEVTIDTEEEFKYNASIKGRINPVHYAYRINPDTAEITYLADNKNFTPAAMGSTTFDYGSWENAFFMPRPCMLKSNGKVDYYLDPNDYSKKLDGTASDIADLTYDGNVMLEFPKIYYKFVPTGDDGEGGTFHCSNVKLDDSYECWCNYDANNNEIDHFYVAAYNAVILDNKMRSLSGYALTQENGADTTTGATEIAAARANNQNGIDEWYTYLISDHQLLTHLATLMCKHVNHQTKFGRGIDSGSTAAKRAYVTGTLNDKGLFWGDTSTGTQGVKIFGIENFYACEWKRAAGLIGTSTGYSYKLTHGTKDGSTATSFNTNGSGYKTIARTKPANGYVTTTHYETNGFWIPAITGTNRYGDYYYNGNGYALVGGGSNNGSNCGSWCVSLGFWVGGSSWSVSSALSCKPRASASGT